MEGGEKMNRRVITLLMAGLLIVALIGSIFVLTASSVSVEKVENSGSSHIDMSQPTAMARPAPTSSGNGCPGGTPPDGGTCN